MAEETNNNKSIRFFANSSLFNKEQEKCANQQEDPIPFGLHLQEPIPMEKQALRNRGATMGPSPTNTPTGSDNCYDLDYEF